MDNPIVRKRRLRLPMDQGTLTLLQISHFPQPALQFSGQWLLNLPQMHASFPVSLS
jgi:hypothetical protein